MSRWRIRCRRGCGPHRRRGRGRGHRASCATAPMSAWKARSSPRYAESLTYKELGYSVIGMTNMPEAKLAREAEICYATVAMVTDFDCWHPDHDAVTVQDIIAVLTANADKAKRLVARLAQRFPARARAVSDRLRPRARHRADHRAGGARSGAAEEARRGGGPGAQAAALTRPTRPTATSCSAPAAARSHARQAFRPRSRSRCRGAPGWRRRRPRTPRGRTFPGCRRPRDSRSASLREVERGEPGLARVRPIAEQQDDMVGLELAAAVQSDANLGSRPRRAPRPCAPPAPWPFRTPDVGAGARPAAGAPCGARERMTRVTRTPFSTSMRDTSKALSPPPITATWEPRSAPGSPDASRAEMEAAGAAPPAARSRPDRATPRRRISFRSRSRCAAPDSGCAARWPDNATSSRNSRSFSRRTRRGRASSQVSTAACRMWSANAAAFSCALSPGRPSSHSLG